MKANQAYINANMNSIESTYECLLIFALFCVIFFSASLIRVLTEKLLAPSFNLNIAVIADAMKYMETQRRRASEAEELLTDLQNKYNILLEDMDECKIRENKLKDQVTSCTYHIKRQRNRLYGEGLDHHVCNLIEKDLPTDFPDTESIGLVDLNPSPVPRCRR